MSLQIVTNTRK